jgi:hypothetical protein
MSIALKGPDPVRRTITLSAGTAERVEGIAEERHAGADRALADLLMDAIAAYEQRRAEYLDLADRFQKSADPQETERLREELARMTFGC